MEIVFERHAPRRRIRRLLIGAGMVAWMATAGVAQKKTLTWDEAKRELDTANPTLRAARIGIQESRADEITAFLRPNPDLTMYVDQVSPIYQADGGPLRPFSDALPFVAGSYLIERRHKRELRRESAQQATAIAISELDDQRRNLLFDLREAFVATLQQKAVVEVTRESLEYYDRMLSVGRDRYKSGDIAQVDLDRMELQRVQFESDVQTALVNLRTAKIHLEALLNDRTPVEQLDVSGRFDFAEIVTPAQEFRQNALDSRADLRAALQAVDKARTDYRLARANGSTDPTIQWDMARQYPLRAYLGVGVNIPLRIFDRNQGEKARTQLDIQRNERLVEANRLEIFSDVDSAYATLESNLILLRPYKARYLQQAARVRETISFSYQHGGASLLDFLQAQQDYRSIQLTYLNLVGSYMSAANQMNFAVGREVIP
jgi:cobalt-zinc-cadmium efflux system outer membrane protein